MSLPNITIATPEYAGSGHFMVYADELRPWMLAHMAATVFPGVAAQAINDSAVVVTRADVVVECVRVAEEILKVIEERKS